MADQQDEKLQQLKARQFVESSMASVQQEVDDVLAIIAAELDLADSGADSGANTDEALPASAGEAMQNAATQIAQVAAALQMTGLAAASQLAAHLQKSLQRLAERGTLPSVRERQAIFESYFLFSRYLSAVQGHYGDPEHDIPPVLAPAFYRLASAGLAPFVDERELAAVSFELNQPFEPLPVAADKPSLRRLRKMYQLAIIGLLRSEQDDCDEQLGLVAHVAERMESQCDHPFSQACWKLMLQLVAAFREDRLPLSAQRRHFFARFDRLLRDMQKATAQELPSAYVQSSLGELAYLLQMAGAGDSASEALPAQVVLGEAVWTEVQVNEQRAAIESGIKDALAAMTDVVNNTLGELKARLGVMEESQICEETDVEFLVERIASVSSAIGFCGFGRPAKELAVALESVQGWASNQPDQDALLKVADAILFVENALLSYAVSGSAAVDDEDGMSLQEGLTYQAHQHLFEELRANIGLANRGISSYMSSNFDREHIANIGECLAATVGGLKIIGAGLAAELMENCSRLLDQEYRSRIPPDTERLESLADALVSTDYMLHELAGGRSIDATMEQLLQQSLDAITHELAA